MNNELKTKLSNVLKAEFDYIKRTETDKAVLIQKMGDIYHMQKIINNFDELEPVIAEYLNKKAERERFER